MKRGWTDRHLNDVWTDVGLDKRRIGQMPGQTNVAFFALGWTNMAFLALGRTNVWSDSWTNCGSHF